MKFFRYYSLAFLALLFFGQAQSFVEVEKTHVYVAPSLGSLRLLHSDYGFIIEKDGNFIPVKPEYIDKEIRTISTENLDYVLGNKAQMTINGYACIFTKLSENALEPAIPQESNVIQLDEKVTQQIIEQLPPSSYIQIVQLSNGDYGLHVRTRVLGGGGLGAAIGAIGGKFLVYAIAGAAVSVATIAVTAVAGPVAGGAIGYGVWGVIAAPVEVASNVAAVSAGITLGVITGPV